MNGDDEIELENEPPPTAEQLDEDALDADPLEEGADAPDEWEPVGETGYGDDLDDESVARYLAAEEPDVEP
ncbi:hypothetical protein VMT65_24325 [Nocardia sp. CDC153]|uniref:hypothetical protein n=1 Tax=Nocardia sp. CDC153 TaxID=3112167 RepID=UPI002DB79C3F|nr:hypothetical protein [Nocardia sp. CDC153]MEC3956186.1 hypothetical protein [Nocardia sp. CDC153]